MDALTKEQSFDEAASGETSLYRRNRMWPRHAFLHEKRPGGGRPRHRIEDIKGHTADRATTSTTTDNLGKGSGKPYVDSEVKDNYDPEKLETLQLPVPKGQPIIDSTFARVDYTMCSPQLLHLGRDGRPLWFKGGLLKNRLSEGAEVADFQVFMKEDREDGKTGTWTPEQDGRICLLSDRLHRFTQQEKDRLDNIIEFAKVAGALGEVYIPQRRR